MTSDGLSYGFARVLKPPYFPSHHSVHSAIPARNPPIIVDFAQVIQQETNYSTTIAIAPPPTP